MWVDMTSCGVPVTKETWVGWRMGVGEEIDEFRRLRSGAEGGSALVVITLTVSPNCKRALE